MRLIHDEQPNVLHIPLGPPSTAPCRKQYIAATVRASVSNEPPTEWQHSHSVHKIKLVPASTC